MINFIKNLRIKTKLIVGFTVVGLFFAVAVVITYFNLNSVQEEYNNLTFVNQEIVLRVTDSQIIVTKISNSLRGYLVYKEDKYYEDYLKLRDDFAKNNIELDRLLKADGQNVDLSTLKKIEEEYYGLFQEIYAKGKNKQFEEGASIAAEKGRPILDRFNAEINRLTTEQKQIIKTESENSSKRVKYTLSLLLTLSLIAVGIAVLSTAVISYFVNKPISLLSNVMQKVADGDLRARSSYESKDELGKMTEAFNQMVDSLKEIITKINDYSVNLLSSTQQISASTEQIAAGSEEQANASQAINTLTNEMAAAIEEVAKSAEQGAISSHEAVEVAKKGAGIAVQSVKGMDAINERINELEVNSQQIGEIVSVIDDVAEQTNLLALNAAIEAARAGDAGKGFAVVADEVRKLAERSSAATKDIAQLIKNIQKNTGDTVKVVLDGTTLTKQVGSAFEDIVKAVEITSNKVSEIAAASEEQAAQATEVVNSVQSIVSITEETSAGAQETAATSQEISRMAEDLSKTVNRFRIA